VHMGSLSTPDRLRNSQSMCCFRPGTRSSFRFPESGNGLHPVATLRSGGRGAGGMLSVAQARLIATI